METMYKSVFIEKRSAWFSVEFCHNFKYTLMTCTLHFYIIFSEAKQAVNKFIKMSQLKFLSTLYFAIRDDISLLPISRKDLRKFQNLDICQVIYPNIYIAGLNYFF